MGVLHFLRPTGAWIFLVAWLMLTAWTLRPAEEVVLDTGRPQTATSSSAPRLP